MIKYTILIWIAVMSFTVGAQYNSEGDNISRFRPGAFWFYSGFRPAQPDKPQKYDRLIVDLTYNDWLGDQGPFENHWASTGVNTNLMFDIPMTKKNDKASFGIGISHEYTNVRHNNKFLINDSLNVTQYVLKDTSDLFFKSALAGNSFSIPIEFRFRSNGWRHFKFHIGGKIGYQANLYSRQVTKQNGRREVTRQYNFPDQSNLIYSAHIRIGIRNWALFASYSFNPIFKESESVQLNRLQMGLSISLF